MKIKYKLVLIICIILSISIIPLALIAIYTSQEIIIENAYTLCKNLSETISNVAKEELFINSTYEGTNRVIHGMDIATIKGLKSISIINVDGIYVEGTEDGNKGKKISESEIDYIKNINTLSYKELNSGKTINLRFTYPIFISNDDGTMKIGAAIFDFDKGKLFHHVDRIQKQIITYSLIIIFFSIVFAFFISIFFTKPIQILKAGVDTIRSGNLNHQINITSKDEIGELADNFNKMAIALKETDRLKDDFLANTTHELKTPLNGIMGLAETILETNVDVKTSINYIIMSSRRLLNLINDILDFSKLRNKELELSSSAVDLRQTVSVVISIAKWLAKDKNLELLNNISEQLSPVEADENRLQQILYNIIGNSIKFTESGYVKIDATEIDGIIQIVIEDTGIGIPSDKFETIFKAFEQVDSSISRTYGGTGLGLSITKKLVELHSGKIWLESVLGQGSKFYFTLKKSLKLVDKKPTSVISKVQLGNENEFVKDDLETEYFNTGAQILIVDDEPVNLRVLTGQLMHNNYIITSALNGKEAIDKLNAGYKPDLVLLDVMMPSMNGYEVCKVIRENFSIGELPIILLTAKNQISDLIDGMESGANDYITKPFSHKELLARVKTHLSVSKTNITYSRFVPMEILRLLNKSSVYDLKLGDQVLENMTILFSDIRSFTALSEKMSPEENFNFINEYLQRIGPVIRFNGGFIDKYIGDAIMALFPLEPENALIAAIEMLKKLAEYNKTKSTPIKIGIGLHYGSLMLGIIGEKERMEGTVISDNVNLASRIESLTKFYGVSIAVSEQLMNRIANPEKYKYRFLDKVKVKGKQEIVSIIEILDGSTDSVIEKKLSTKQLFEMGQYCYFNAKFEDAKLYFDKVLEIDPDDKAAGIFQKRCENYSIHGSPEGWEGVEVLTDK